MWRALVALCALWDCAQALLSVPSSGKLPRGAASWTKLGVATAEPSAAVAPGTPYGEMTIGVPKEADPAENRVAQTPESLAALVKAGFGVLVERGAGTAAGFDDGAYEAAGAKVVDGAAAWGASIVTKIAPPTPAEAERIGDRTLLSMVSPAQNEPCWSSSSLRARRSSRWTASRAC